MNVTSVNEVPMGMHPMSQDVELALERSRRERAEAAEHSLRRAIAFKNTLIQDAYHRMANTVQATAGLLSMQARTTTAIQARTALEEAVRRLRLIAKVNELLYSRAGLGGKIEIAPLLCEVARCVEQAFAEQAKRVSVRLHVDAVSLLADDAVAMTLLANEALTNAYKHAFPPGMSGQIALVLKSGVETLVLEISDTGVGISGSSRRGSLGLVLLRNFAAQMGGTLHLARGDSRGTTVRLTLSADRLLRDAPTANGEP